MATQIKIRRDTAANWTSQNPILAQGEPALETDTKKQKIGDGTTAWTSLAYIGALGGDVVGPSSAVDENIAVYDSTTGKLIKDGLINKSVIQLNSEKANVYNVKTYGALGDGIDLLDGAITATDATFTSITSAFVAGDVGKVIAVEGAGTAGAYHITTIASFTGAGEVELTDVAVTTVSASNFYYGTDDTDDIQTAIQAAFDAGGGTVYIPNGVYIIDGPLLNNVGPDLIDYNSQLYVPGQEGFSVLKTSIEIEGETWGNQAQSGGAGSGLITSSRGSCLRSTIQGSGTFPAVIANEGAAAWVNSISYTTAIFKKLNIQVTPDGNNKVTMGGINCLGSSVARFEQIVAFPFATDFTDNSDEPDVIDVGGLIGPDNGGEHTSTITACYVGGFTYGYLISDHMNLHESSAICCTNGIMFRDSGQFCSATKVVVHWCINVIGVIRTVTDSRIYVHQIQIEISDAAGKWFDFVSTIDDPSNFLIGTINHAEFPYDGTSYVKIGGNNITTNLLNKGALVNIQSGTTYTPTILDAYRITKLTNASPITVTIPPYTDLNFDHNTRIDFYQAEAGQVTFVGGTGVTIQTAETLKLRKQWSVCSLVKQADNVWLITGDLELV